MTRMVWFGLLAGCSSYQEQLSNASAPAEEPEAVQFGVLGTEMVGGRFGAAADAAPAARMKTRGGENREEALILLQDDPEADSAGSPNKDAEAERAPGRSEDGGKAAVRRWFPEAFLWQPRVVTDEGGTATVEVRVPDQLTTWRVLALAHDREGHQAGAVHTFDSRLPVYVDPVVPGWLTAGDKLSLPVQVVNSTAEPIVASLEVEASGAMRGIGMVQSVRLAGGGSDVRTLPLTVTGAGSATIVARLDGGGESDAAERRIPVQPAGRPVERVRGSTLASTASFQLAPPVGADPVTEELSVLVFGGPLAVLQSEVRRLLGGARPVDGAYGFALATHLRALSEAAAVEFDEVALRKLTHLAWQRTVPQARTTAPSVAADLLGSLAGVTGHELVDAVRPQLEQVVVDHQRADGTWSREASSTLQRVLVETAVAARALGETHRGATLRAQGAAERYAREVNDPYTAAALLASGLSDGSQAEYLLGVLEEGLSESAEGARTLEVPNGVRNPWGRTPSKPEVLAWAVLALPEGHAARGDLVSELMSRWSGAAGFGAGPADTLALQAVVAGLPATPNPVTVALSVDGEVVSRGRLDPSEPGSPLLLEGRPRGGNVPIELTAEPAAAGLAFVATRRSWVPWTNTTIPGVDVNVSTSPLARGVTGALTLTAAAPSGSRLVIEQGLPAGAHVEPPSAATQLQGAVVEVFTDRVRITTGRFGPGTVLDLELAVTPAFAGRFSTGPLTISVDNADPVALRPLVWRVGER